MDMKAIGVTDAKMYCRMKMLSILKKQIKSVLRDVRKYTYPQIKYFIFKFK